MKVSGNRLQVFFDRVEKAMHIDYLFGFGVCGFSFYVAGNYALIDSIDKRFLQRARIGDQRLVALSAAKFCQCVSDGIEQC